MEENMHYKTSVEVIAQVEQHYLEAEKARWIADAAGDAAQEEFQAEIAAKWEAINRLAAPHAFEFLGFNKLDQMTTIPYRIKLLQDALPRYEHDFFYRENIELRIVKLREAQEPV